MTEGEHPNLRSELYALVLLSGVVIALYGITLLVPRDLWVQDEARYGEVVREMLDSGEWLVPRLNAHPYPDKPPLYFWIVILTGALIGHGELAFRAVTALFTAVSVAGVYLTGREIAGRAVAFWSAALFATTFLTMIVGQIVRMDMLLTAAAAFAWYSLLVYRARHSPWHLVAFWTCTLLAVALKGPIALLFTVLPAVVWLAADSGWQGVRSLRLTRGVMATGGMVALWIGAVVAAGHAQYLRDIWHEQLLGRAVDSWSHKEPFYFYLALAPLFMMPWTGLVFRGGLELFRRRSPSRNSIAAFSLAPLLGISLVSGKLFIYMQPLVPALCIAAGVAAADLRFASRMTPWLAWPPVLFLLALSLAAFWLSHGYLDGYAARGYGAGLGLLVLGAIAAVLGRNGGGAWLTGWLLISVCLSWLLYTAMATLVNPLFSARSMGEAVSRLAADGRAIGVVRSTRGIFNYYAGSLMVELQPGEVPDWWRAHPDAVLIIKTRHLGTVFGAAASLPPCRVDKVFNVELKEYHVVADCSL
jgi:4-amino-4-deoxy-L-arabinose transferase-like glycosyltransferase